MRARRFCRRQPQRMRRLDPTHSHVPGDSRPAALWLLLVLHRHLGSCPSTPRLITQLDHQLLEVDHALAPLQGHLECLRLVRRVQAARAAHTASLRQLLLAQCHEGSRGVAVGAASARAQPGQLPPGSTACRAQAGGAAVRARAKEHPEENEWRGDSGHAPRCPRRTGLLRCEGGTVGGRHSSRSAEDDLAVGDQALRLEEAQCRRILIADMIDCPRRHETKGADGRLKQLEHDRVRRAERLGDGARRKQVSHAQRLVVGSRALLLHKVEDDGRPRLPPLELDLQFPWEAWEDGRRANKGGAAAEEAVLAVGHQEGRRAGRRTGQAGRRRRREWDDGLATDGRHRFWDWGDDEAEGGEAVERQVWSGWLQVEADGGAELARRILPVWCAGAP
eukprot:scaffold9553_cov114-Isochrysis_galbana.AAC.13